MAAPFVSVIVPVYNDPRGLQTCLAALEIQSYPQTAYEVIAVDNGSDEGIAPILSHFRQARGASESRPGSYAARNAGLARARGDIIAFTDADCIPAPDWVEKGVARLLNLPGCGLVAGKVEVFFRDPRRPTAVELYDGLTAFPQRRLVEVSRFGATANVFTFRQVVERVGGFDDRVKSGGDLEWGQRVAAAGYQLVYAEEVRVAHPARRSFGQLYRKVARRVGGAHDLKGLSKSFFPGMDRGLIGDAIPALRRALAVLRDGELTGLSDRLKVAAVTSFVCGVVAWEGLRLKLGGTSRR
jgi:glycosyltransferase involved in cell wall biosynthesis